MRRIENPTLGLMLEVDSDLFITVDLSFGAGSAETKPLTTSCSLRPLFPFVRLCFWCLSNSSLAKAECFSGMGSDVEFEPQSGSHLILVALGAQFVPLLPFKSFLFQRMVAMKQCWMPYPRPNPCLLEWNRIRVLSPYSWLQFSPPSHWHISPCSTFRVFVDLFQPWTPGDGAEGASSSPAELSGLFLPMLLRRRLTMDGGYAASFPE